MKETKNVKSPGSGTVILMAALGLLVVLIAGCQQINDAINSNKATNSNTTSNTNANVNANSNANANTSASPTNSAANSNTQASNTAANTAPAPKEEVPLTEEAKVFKNDLVGKWTDGRETVTFTETKIETSMAPGKTHTYRVVNENTIEATQDWDNRPWKATMKIEDDGNTMLWYNETQRKNLKYTRVK